ncbi:MAG: putative phosphite transport system-binding protein PtxB [Candidatus Moanabacter tarae]|uniref:Putative phosphite transport system-binding protein PtxB n=1 Tax=Candidatus Moanibacter tarae TaxID=2200854 RepID=A0A2Z4AF45_9BACT|nr:MAG: putative phosphite transport system-binding protein PtxB [Candidatus Moanabacter tarae]
MRHLIIVMALSLACFGPACTEESVTRESITIALKPDKNPDRLIKEKAALEVYLSDELLHPVKVIVPLSSAVITTGFANGSIDLGFLSSTEAAKAINAEVADVLLAGEIDGSTHYLSYWVSLKENSYSSIEELRGKPIAFSSRTSTSGFLIPTWDLFKRKLITEDEGPEGFFGEGNVFYGVGYVSAIEKVLSGEVEAAAVSYYVIDEDRYLTPVQRSRLRMVSSQGPVPTHTISCRRTLDLSLRNRVKKVLLQMNQNNSKLRDLVFNSKLVEVDPKKHLRISHETLSIVSRMKL